jgi:hypothetical protein
MAESSKSGAGLAKQIRDKNCTTDQLAALVGINSKSDRLIAAHQNAGSEVLKRLSSSKDALTREFATGNPNTPLNVLFELAEEFPRAFLSNPAFELMALEDPAALERLHASTLAKIVAQKECPTSIVEWAFKHYRKKGAVSSDVLLGIVQNPKTPAKFMVSILKIDLKTDVSCQECLL